MSDTWQEADCVQSGQPTGWAWPKKWTLSNGRAQKSTGRLNCSEFKISNSTSLVQCSPHRRISAWIYWWPHNWFHITLVCIQFLSGLQLEILENVNWNPDDVKSAERARIKSWSCFGWKVNWWGRAWQEGHPMCEKYCYNSCPQSTHGDCTYAGITPEKLYGWIKICSSSHSVSLISLFNGCINELNWTDCCVLDYSWRFWTGSRQQYAARQRVEDMWELIFLMCFLACLLHYSLFVAYSALRIVGKFFVGWIIRLLSQYSYYSH